MQRIPLWAVLGLCAAGCVKVNESFDEEDILTETSTTSVASSEGTSTTAPPPTTMGNPATTEPPPPPTTGPGDTMTPTTQGTDCTDEFEPNDLPPQSVGVGDVTTDGDKMLVAQLEPDGADWYDISGRPQEPGQPKILLDPGESAGLRACLYIQCVEAELENAECEEGLDIDGSMTNWTGCCGLGGAGFDFYECTGDVIDVDMRARITGPDNAPCTEYVLTASI